MFNRYITFVVLIYFLSSIFGAQVVHATQKSEESTAYWTLQAEQAAQRGDHQSEFDALGKLRASWQKLRNKNAEAETLIKLADASKALNKEYEGKQYIDEALIITKKIHDPKQKRQVLNSIGVSYKNLGEFKLATDCLKQALKLSKKINDRVGEAAAFYNMSGVYYQKKEYEQAIESAKQSLPIFEKLKSHLRYAQMYAMVGQSYRLMANYPEAIEWFNKTIDIANKHQLTEVKQLARLELFQTNELLAKHNEGAAYAEQYIHENEKSDNNALRIYHARFSIKSKQYTKAIDTLNSVLASARKQNNKQQEAWALYLLGEAYNGLQDYKSAKASLEQALKFYIDEQDKIGGTMGINTLSTVLANMGHRHQAFGLLREAITYAQEIKDSRYSEVTFNNLMHLYFNQGSLAQGIFYGKKAINLLQKQRADFKIINLNGHPPPKELQTEFVLVNKESYERLIEMMLLVGRVDEAIQVEKMLKEDELFEFSGHDPVLAAESATQIDYTEAEIPLDRQLENLAKNLVHLSDRKKQCKATANQSQAVPTDAVNCDSASNVLLAARQEFNLYLDQIHNTLAQAPTVKSVAEIKLPNFENVRRKLSAIKQKTIYLHYLLTPEYVYIVGTPLNANEKSFKQRVDIASADLNDHIRHFTLTLQNPKVKVEDAKKHAQALYDKLVKPIEGDLKRINPKVLMISNMGVLRQIPFAALYDGQAYLSERYALANVILTTEDKLTQPPDTDYWSVAGLGVTGASNIILSEQGHTFYALRTVDEELDSIVKVSKTDDDGVFPGEIKLDGAFTKLAFADAAKHFKCVAHRQPFFPKYCKVASIFSAGK